LVPSDGRQVAGFACKAFAKESSGEDGFSPGGCEPRKNNSSIALDMQFGDQSFRSELFLDAYMMEVNYKRAYTSVRQWNCCIWKQLHMCSVELN
jgi:hypothetical protein